MKEIPILPVPITSTEPDVTNDATFTTPNPNGMKDTVFLVRNMDYPNIESFTNTADKSKITPQQKQQIVDAVRADIDWVKQKLASLGERTHVALTGTNDFYSDITLTTIEVNSRV